MINSSGLQRAVVATTLSCLLAFGAALSTAHSATVDELAVKTAATANNAPPWTKGGAFVYRVSTPDAANVLPELEQGFAITEHLLDGSIPQIPIINGLIGHDHLGLCNWDGAWPYWDRVTFRAGDWPALHDFMQQVKARDNVSVSFHVNLTDVNAGLRDYPETRAFFEKLVATKSIYRRDWDRAIRKLDLEPPYIPQELPTKPMDARAIIALVNYKNFWDSGLARQMIDNFYSHLPYAPPILYLDVLTLSGGNFSTGFPTGPLGGSEETQREGVLEIAAWLNGKGTSVATEGDRPYLIGKGATYGWFHCHPGYSSDDYAYIAGASRYEPLQQVAGNTGCFNVSPVSSTPEMLAKVRAHYANLLAGRRDAKTMPGLPTWHLSNRGDTRDEFDTCPPGNVDSGFAGDAFRGDWADLVNDFYLTGIQELYHIGKGNFRTAVFNKTGMIHVSKFGFVDSAGKETFVAAVDCASKTQLKDARERGEILLAPIIQFHFHAPKAAKYAMNLYGVIRGNGSGAANVYVNGALQLTIPHIDFANQKDPAQLIPLGQLTLNSGDNAIAVDAGPIYMRWSDGTAALWATPYLRKGFKVTNGDVTFADDYDRMWPDTWSGQKKIYFFSWDGSRRTWTLPLDWASVHAAMLLPLTPDGRGTGVPVEITGRSVTPRLLPQVPYVLVPR